MTTPAKKPVFRTLAAVAAVSLAGAAFANPAHALEDKIVKLAPAQYPQLIDNAGDANDVVRVFNVQGLKWTVGGAVVDFAGMSAKDVKVTAATDVVASEVTGDPLYSYRLAGGPTTWKMAAPTNVAVTKTPAAKVVPSWFDAPGTKSDSVTFPKIAGVTWTVTDGTVVKNYTEKDFGTKTSITVKLPKGTEVVSFTHDADLIDGTPAAITSGVTSTAAITYTTDQVTKSAVVGANPLDKWKGFGKGAAVETVRVSGLAGVKYQVGTNKAVAVKGIKDLAVDPSDLEEGNGKVDVVVTSANASYGLAAGEKQTITLDFTDGAESTVTLAPKSAATAVVTTDLGGAPSDTLSVPAIENMTWWIGQKNAKTGKIDYRAQKAGKDGTVKYKVRHTPRAKGSTAPLAKAHVFVKPVADRGYVLDTSGWTPPATGWEFSQENIAVPVANLGVKGTNDVTLAAHDGVLQWTITEKTTPAAGKATTKNSTYKVADLKKIGATAIVVPTKVAATGETVDVTVTPKLAKFYEKAAATP